MPKGFPGRTCRQCGVNERDGYIVSSTRLCEGCGEQNLVASINQQVHKRGPIFDKWLTNITAGVEKVKRDRVTPVRSAKKRRRSAA